MGLIHNQLVFKDDHNVTARVESFDDWLIDSLLMSLQHDAFVRYHRYMRLYCSPSIISTLALKQCWSSGYQSHLIRVKIV